MKPNTLLFILFISVTSFSYAQEKLMHNVYNRQSTSLNGYWKYIVDPYENGFYNYRYEPFDEQKNPGKGAFYLNSKRESKSDLVEYDFDKMDSILVPGDWNTQKEKLFYYEGTIWLKKSFDYTKSKNTNRVFVYFEASNYQTDVYLNGKKLGVHTGGFTPFNFEVTDLLKEKDNFLIVKVDNKRKREAVPTLNTDWWNYGGMTRELKLIETSGTFVKDYFIRLDPDNNKRITGELTLNGKNIGQNELQISIPELNVKQRFDRDKNGRFSVEIISDKITYWSGK